MWKVEQRKGDQRKLGHSGVVPAPGETPSIPKDQKVVSSGRASPSPSLLVFHSSISEHGSSLGLTSISPALTYDHFYLFGGENNYKLSLASLHSTLLRRWDMEEKVMWKMSNMLTVCPFTHKLSIFPVIHSRTALLTFVSMTHASPALIPGSVAPWVGKHTDAPATWPTLESQVVPSSLFGLEQGDWCFMPQFPHLGNGDNHSS